MYTFFFLIFYCCSFLSMERLEESTPLLQKKDYIVINILPSSPLPRLPHEIVKHIKSDLPVGDSAWCCLASHYGMSESEETIIAQRLLNGLAQESENYTDLKKRIKNLKAFKKCKHGLNSVNEQLKIAVACELETELAPYLQTINLRSKTGEIDLLTLLTSISTTITQSTQVPFHSIKIKQQTYCKNTENKFILHDQFKNEFKNFLICQSGKTLVQWSVKMKKLILYLEHCNTIATKNNNIFNATIGCIGVGSFGSTILVPTITKWPFDTSNFAIILAPFLLTFISLVGSFIYMPNLKDLGKLISITHQWKKMCKTTAQMIEDEKKNRIV